MKLFSLYLLAIANTNFQAQSISIGGGSCTNKWYPDYTNNKCSYGCPPFGVPSTSTGPDACCESYFSSAECVCKANTSGATECVLPGTGYAWYPDVTISTNGISTVSTKCLKEQENLIPPAVAAFSEDIIFVSADLCCSIFFGDDECSCRASSEDGTTCSPTNSPTKNPTSSPTMPQPTAQPTTAQPTASPTKTPTISPTSLPSKSPTSSPTLPSPTQSPTKRPTVSPTKQPTKSPILAPTSSPTKSPIPQPTSSPTASPTKNPSSSPTRVPSTSPTKPPTHFPTQSPTTPSPTGLYYPDWESPIDQQRCLNDGNEPEYMTLNPAWQSASLESCCWRYFNFNFEFCLGIIVSDGQKKDEDTILDDSDNVDNVSSGKTDQLYYPDWEGAANICKNDGHAPEYMTRNPSMWMHTSLSSCCDKYFNWDMPICMGIETDEQNQVQDAIPDDADNADAIDTDILFYPDWEGTANICKNDGSAPSYMTRNPTLWMHTSLESCCDKNFHWDKPICMGIEAVDTMGLWYPDWEDGSDGLNEGGVGCKNDGNQPKYMTNNPTVWMHATLESCCRRNSSWDLNSCLGIDTVDTSGLWYPDWDSGSGNSVGVGCINDGNAPIYMTNNPSVWMHESLESCCQRNNQWDLNGCMGIDSNENDPNEGTQAGSGMWYPDFDLMTCVKDCVGDSQCGGLANDWDKPLFTSKSSCCLSRMAWNDGCDN